MNWVALPYALPAVVTTPLSILVASICWRRREVPGALALMALALGVVVWSGSYAGELLSAGLEAKRTWALVSYVGIGVVPAMWLVFGLQYSGRKAHLRPGVVFLLSLVPCITFLLVATTGWHGLVWRSVSMPAPGAAPGLVIDHGPWFWFNIVWSYALTLSGSVLLFASAVTQPASFRRQGVAVLVASLIPLAGNALFLLGASPADNLDLTPLVFGISGVILAWGLFRLRLLDLFLGILPYAREAVVRGMEDGVVVLDPRDQIVYLNDAAASIAGRHRSVVLGKPVVDVFGDPFAPGAEGKGIPHTWVDPGSDNGDAGREFDVTSSRLSFKRGKPAGRVVVLRDITLRRQAESALAESERRYRDIFENASDIIFTVGLDGSFISLNQAGERVTGYTREEILGLALRDALGETQFERVEAILASRLPEGGTAVYDVEILAKDGHHVSLEVSSKYVYEDGEPVGVQSVARDVTERRRWEEALRHQALHDALTELPNRTLLQDRLQEAIVLAQRTGESLALLVMDLDRFKEINDTYGHQVGDLVLQQTGRRLEGALRRSDTIARLGGDEFAVLLWGADVEAAVRAARKLLARLERPFEVFGRRLTVGGSVGIALCPDHGSDAGTLLRQADVAMYTAKRLGGGFSVYAFDQDPHSPQRLTLLNELRVAIDHDEFTVVYQPQIDLRSGHVARVEALSRWQHPRVGLVMPEQFIPLAEETGWIRSLTFWVMEIAFRQCLVWQQEGWLVDVAINVTARTLHDPELPARVAGIVQSADLDPARVILEVAEGGILMDPERGIDILRRLSALGVRLAVDGFGSEHSPRMHLEQLPVDEIKIDKSYMHGLRMEGENVATVGSMIDRAHELGLVAVGQGVETRAAWEALASLGCDLAQGYFVSLPLPAASVTGWLSDWNRRRKQ